MRAETRGEASRDAGRTDIPGDVIAEVMIVQAETRQRARNSIACVVADHDDRRIRRSVDDLERRWLVGR